jgi:hypothetical protein
MQTGNLLTVIVSFGVGIVGIVVYGVSHTVSERYRSSAVRAFAKFWLTMGGVWCFTGFATLVRFLGYQTASLKYVYMAQCVLGVSMIFGILFISEVLYSKRTKKISTILYCLLYILFLITLFSYNLVIPAAEYFSSHILTPPQTRIVFITMFIPLWLSAFVLLTKTIRDHNSLETPIWRFYMLAALSLIILGISGFLDEVGLIQSWIVALIRIISLSSSLLGLIGMILLREEEGDFRI